MGSALLDTTTLDADLFETGGPSDVSGSQPRQPLTSAEALRLQAAERLAAHRSRRVRAQAYVRVESAGSKRATDSRTARIAAAVTEHYARSQSYCAYLAAEAERAVRQAQAAAEVAALNAQAMLAAQQTLLDALSRQGFDANAVNSKLDVATAAQELSPHPDGDREEEGAKSHPELQECLPQELLLWPGAEVEGIKPAPRARATAASARTTSARPRAATPANPSPSVDTAMAPAQPLQATSLFHTVHGGLSVRLCDEAARIQLPSPLHVRAAGALAVHASRPGFPLEAIDDYAEALALDAEIAFRLSPVFEEPAGPPMQLPANLIEFPRQLVASRKARPRLAEGPLREDPEAMPQAGQLRIFEVDPAHIDTTPVNAPATAGTPVPQWTSIWLDAPGRALPEREAATEQTGAVHAADSFAAPVAQSSSLPQVASIRRRVAAGAIDGAVIFGGFLASSAAFVFTSCHAVLQHSGAPPDHAMHTIAEQIGLQPGMVLVAGAATFAFLYLLYQALFFSFSGATPGMRAARIALCTFAEENPARSAMRRRILAVLLSACPLGLGFLWAAFDEERLTWHDRVSRMYQRSY
jgi:uncharacterized RDD family membrane protein YckC